MDVPHVSALLPSVLRKGRQGYSETITLVGRSTCSHVVEDSIVDCGNIVIKRQEYIHTYIHTHTNKHTIFYLAQQAPPPQWARAHWGAVARFLDHTQRRTTVGWTPLDEWSSHRRDLYLTKHDTHNRETSMLPVGFEPPQLQQASGRRPTP